MQWSLTPPLCWSLVWVIGNCSLLLFGCCCRCGSADGCWFFSVPWALGVWFTVGNGFEELTTNSLLGGYMVWVGELVFLSPDWFTFSFSEDLIGGGCERPQHPHTLAPCFISGAVQYAHGGPSGFFLGRGFPQLAHTLASWERNGCLQWVQDCLSALPVDWPDWDIFMQAHSVPGCSWRLWSFHSTTWIVSYSYSVRGAPAKHDNIELAICLAW